MACGRQLPRFRLIDAFDEHFDVINDGAGDLVTSSASAEV